MLCFFRYFREVRPTLSNCFGQTLFLTSSLFNVSHNFSTTPITGMKASEKYVINPNKEKSFKVLLR